LVYFSIGGLLRNPRSYVLGDFLGHIGISNGICKKPRVAIFGDNPES